MGTKIDINSPLYLHPSEGTTLNIEKLEGSSNYRSWRSSMEIALDSKRKQGFITGGEKKETSDSIKAKAWETCNNMVMAWILGSTFKSIKKSVMFMQSAESIWKQLESRFAVPNGSRKYQLCKAMFGIKQQGTKVADYYTDLKCLWEEYDSLKDLPLLTKMNTEMTAFVKAMRKEEDDQKLFQFINGLSEQFGTLRSHVLMLTPLPSVEAACGMFQREESQQEIFTLPKEEQDAFAMYESKIEMKCTNCGKIGHTIEKCWACKVIFVVSR
ncbi:uncharacterized protein LOC110686350 [Chenopodium quinoa]|uniref:uncharacterized protein LOC110686350 n=1 Tax=Chenopodium quinoa TaxID=63459 RepID=UPI000B7838AD|nr:uncharacterized protein LOC110686350 [Chenopodium quinoa]